MHDRKQNKYYNYRYSVQTNQFLFMFIIYVLIIRYKNKKVIKTQIGTRKRVFS